MNNAKTSAAALGRGKTHLDEVGETYFEHMGHAFSFARRMIWGGLCCMVHGICPPICCKTGSATIEELHQQMCLHRNNLKHRAAPERT